MATITREEEIEMGTEEGIGGEEGRGG
jgi:hypothetical protein